MLKGRGLLERQEEPVEYLVQLHGSASLGAPPVNDHPLSEGANLTRKAVEADTPEAAANLLLSDVTDRTAVDEVWVTHQDRTWVYGRDGTLLRGGVTGDLEDQAAEPI